MKMDILNDLLAQGYSVLFIMDQIISDHITNEQMEGIAYDITERHPDPEDTTHYLQRNKECSSFTTLKQQKTRPQKLTMKRRSTHLTLV